MSKCCPSRLRIWTLGGLAVALFGCDTLQDRFEPRPANSAPPAASSHFRDGGALASASERDLGARSTVPSTLPVVSDADALKGSPTLDACQPSPLATDWTRSLDNWARCYEGYRVGTNPSIDAYRLGLLCGPSNGMHRKRKTTVGNLAPQDRTRLHLEERVKEGECLRWVVVAQPSIAHLGMAIKDASKALPHRFDRPAGRWRVVPPLEPWCASQAGVVAVDIESLGGAGKVFVETWSAR